MQIILVFLKYLIFIDTIYNKIYLCIGNNNKQRTVPNSECKQTAD